MPTDNNTSPPGFPPRYQVAPTEHVYSLRSYTPLRTHGSSAQLIQAEQANLHCLPFDKPDMAAVERHLRAVLTPEKLFADMQHRTATINRLLMNGLAYELASDLAAQHPGDKVLETLLKDKGGELGTRGAAEESAAKLALRQHMQTLPEFTGGQALEFSVNVARRHFWTEDMINERLLLIAPEGVPQKMLPESARLVRRALKKLPVGKAVLTPDDLFDRDMLEKGRDKAVATDLSVFEAELKDQLKYWHDRLRTNGCEHPEKPGYTQAEAEEKMRELIGQFPPEGVATTLARISLADPKLMLVVSRLSETFQPMKDDFHSMAHHIHRYGKDGWLGSSDHRVKEVNVAASAPEAMPTLLHELTHYGLGIIYRNENQEPWIDATDARKALFLEALRADRKLHGAPIVPMRRIMRKDMEMAEVYRSNDFPVEVPVRIIESLAMGKWDSANAKKYPHLTRFVKEIIGEDARRHEQGETLAPMTEQEAQLYRKAAPVAEWREAIRQSRDAQGTSPPPPPK
ncbi:MAG: hypothetical protein K2Q01_03060 [Rickettsiales bacterium]|nr:hypothetical protein [Rickettsiales bacterium]